MRTAHPNPGSSVRNISFLSGASHPNAYDARIFSLLHVLAYSFVSLPYFFVIAYWVTVFDYFHIFTESWRCLRKFIEAGTPF
jgi:hypothetical protein